MATFEATQGMRNQHHFEVFEVDLPVITGACTLGAVNGTGTPLTCDQEWTGEYKTYYFTKENAPILSSVNGEPIYRLIKSIKETSTELKPGDGLSSRSSLTIVLAAGKGLDPNIGAPGVTDTVKKQGDFLGKTVARQIVENKNARLKLYRVENGGVIDLANGAQVRSFLSDTLSLNKNGTWTWACKDVLSLVNLGEKSWPINQGGFLRQDINSTSTTLDVDEFVDWSSAEVVRIGDEHFRVNSVSNNLTDTATLNVTTRGLNIVATVSGEILTTTEADDHSAGDEVFICDVSDNETIDSLLTKILVESDFPVGLIPAAEWAAEVAEWHANDKINTLHNESKSVNDVINLILTGFLMDLWFSVTENKARLSAISVHKQSSALLIEGREINAYSIKKTAKEGMRATRALVTYDKDNLADSDDTSSFNKGSQFSDNTLISPALYVKHKDKSFENNHLLDKDSADLLTQRYVSRFKFTPFERSFVTDERYLTFNTGDVVDLATTVDQTIFGLPSGNIRGQVTKINPNYEDGRKYDVKILTYEAAFDSGSEIVLDSPLGSVNLYILAGAPSQPIDLTFVLDGSYSLGGVAIRAGNFPMVSNGAESDSKIIIILANGFDGQANAGDGGAGGTGLGNGIDGGAGGIVYDAQGVDTDIYFSGATPSTSFPVADGYMRAPGGGGGGGGGVVLSGNRSGGGGGGGGGRVHGNGGSAFDPATAGTNGDIIGNGGVKGIGDSLAGDGGDGGDWGQDGVNGQDGSGFPGTNGDGGSGGNAGSGIIDSGATVTLFGDTPSRYINGAGSHP